MIGMCGSIDRWDFGLAEGKRHGILAMHTIYVKNVPYLVLYTAGLPLSANCSHLE